MPTPARIAILVGPKGRGSNMKNLALACRDGRVPAQVSVVVGQKEDAPAIGTAKELGLNTRIVPPEEPDYGLRLLDALDAVDFVLLAGYIRLLPIEIVQAFPHRILNIHPALLPKYGGKGMYGMRVHEAVLAAGEKESGCTVHYVNEVYDDGEIIVQRRCPVLAGDTAESLSARVLEQEHLAYPEALAKVVAGM